MKQHNDLAAPPNIGFEPPKQPPRVLGLLDLIGPSVSGLGGSVVVLLLLQKIVFWLIPSGITTPYGLIGIWIIGFWVIMLLTAAVGAGLGFAGGAAAWFLGKRVLTGWWNSSR